MSKKTIIVIVVFLLLSIVLAALTFQSKSSLLTQQVRNSVSREFEKIQLPQEVKEERAADECRYDYKVGSMRCRNKYIKYFASNNDPVDEFIRVRRYLYALGWEASFGREQTRDDLEQAFKVRSEVFEIYQKKSDYALELHLSFYKKEVLKCTYCEETSKKVFEQYSAENKSVYSISVTSDLAD